MIERLELLSPDAASAAVAEALEVLSTLGIALRDPEAIRVLGDHGARVDHGSRIFLPADLVQCALAAAPKVVPLFDTRQRQTHEIGGDRQYFVPGSTATTVLDRATGRARAPTTCDYVEYVKVLSGLPHLEAQSTAFVPSDVPSAIADSYRLYLSLRHGEKPVVTGTFSAAGFAVMRDLQLAVRAGSEGLRSMPLTIFSCCPTSPLAWSDDAARTLVDCALSGIPVEIVPMPLAGFIAPVSLAGTLVQHTAEVLSGIAIAQLARPGTPVLYGGASTIFDFRYETTPMGAIESMMLACGAAQIARHLDLPSQAYIATSDARSLDAQAGLETGMGAVIAALAGINQVAGPGMLDFGNGFSLEKLVVDHEICAITARLRAGITATESRPIDVIAELLRDRHLLIATDTRRHRREQISLPGPTIDRRSRKRWIEEGAGTLSERAAGQVDELVRCYRPPERPDDMNRALDERMRFEARRCGLEALPTCER